MKKLNAKIRAPIAASLAASSARRDAARNQALESLAGYLHLEANSKRTDINIAESVRCMV